MEIQSTPKQSFTVVSQCEPEPYSATGVVFRAYRTDGTPLYVGAETLEQLKEALRTAEPNAVLDERKFIWFHDPTSLPVKKGDTVTIPKGTTIRTTHPKLDQKVKIARRVYHVVVDHILPGCRPGGLTPNGLNPRVRWAGKDRYWFEVDINDVPEAQRST